MNAIRLQFSELLASAEQAGFEIVDGGGLPVNEPLLRGLEEDNLMAAHARVSLRSVSRDRERAVIADVAVGEQSYRVVGSPRHREELENLLRGVADESYE